jgi:hypothetical protein
MGVPRSDEYEEAQGLGGCIICSKFKISGFGE